MDQNKDPHKHTQQSFESRSTEKSRLKARGQIQSYGSDYFNPTAENHKLYELITLQKIKM